MKTREELLQRYEEGRKDQQAMREVLATVATYMASTYLLQITYAQPISQQQTPHAPIIYSGRIDFQLHGTTYRTQRIRALIERIYTEPANETLLLQIIYNAI